MGELLGRLTDRSFTETRNRPGGALMISVLCMYLDQNNVGRGFYAVGPTYSVDLSQVFNSWVAHLIG
jgi:hypothetical protein